MSEPTSTYTFLPWLRTGIGARLAQSSIGAGRASVQLKLHIKGDGIIRRTVNRSVELYGPGDILGVSTRAIVRTVPRQGTRDFESNFLAAIDFYDEDFPWRYSPAAPNANRVAPWLWLLTLEKAEFDLMAPLESGLPIARLRAGVAQNVFPKPDQTWAWAHAHVNFNVVEDQNSQLEAVLHRLETELDKNPNLGCSRLLCPRRLKPETEYAAFLIRAFEKGRLAGLGADLSLIDSTNSLQAAWAPQAFLPDHFPIYYQWSFSTMPGGDFEELARKIEPVTRAQLLAAGIGTPLTMDIRSPGWGVKHGDPTPTVVLPSVFRLPESPPEPEFPAPAPSKDAAWADGLAELLNLSVQMQEGEAAFQQQNPIYQDAATVGNDPVVTPPVYGSWYVPPARVERGKMKNDWFHHMNLHPALRVVGGAGAEVIRGNQEDYMERAWEQCDEIGETNRFIKIAQLSSNVGMALFSKHLKASLDSLFVQTASTQQVRGLRLASMTRTAKVIASQAPSVQARSLVASGAIRMFRPNGALMTRLPPPLPPTGTTKFWLQDLRLNVVQTMVFVTPVFDVVQLTNTAVLNPNLAIIRISIGGMNGEKINSALQTHRAYFLPSIVPLILPPAVSQSISERLRPDIAIAKKVRARLPEAVPPGAPTNDVALLRVAPDFPEPVVDALAAQSLDLIMPGLDKFPVNRCGVFESNQTFIEAYMVGLNHEMAREMLWREFPADLRQTFFRQFWDKRDTPASTGLSTASASVKDIRPIAEWGTPTPFGDASHRVGASADLLFFVLRGDLLRKYPNTVVFMQPAIRKPNGRVPDETQPLKMPVVSARLAQDIFFLGFDVPKVEAIGNAQKAGWYIGLQERPGDIHFGLDQSGPSSPTEPNWENADTLPGQCLDLEKPKPLFTGLRQAADVAVLFYQQPFMMLVHAGKMLS